MDFAPGPAPQLPIEAFAARRERLFDQLDGPLLVATNPETTYSNDVEHRFRPHSDFWYLTGFAEPESVLLLDHGKSTLFLRDRKPEAEVWNGRRLGVARAAGALQVDAAFAIDDLARHLKGLSGRIQVHAEHNPSIAETIANHIPDSEPGHEAIHEMRLRKDAAEVDLLRKACDVGAQAMRAALSEARPGVHEYELEATLLAHYRRAGSTGPGYPAIVGTGDNAAILHYIENRSRLEAGQLLLVDAGCEWGYYNSDITRTVPVGGDWGPGHREMYQLVWEAQKAAFKEARPGRRLKDVHDAAVQVLAQGFADMGWLDGDVAAIIEAQDHRRFYMHGTSHFLGLDVHDVGRYKEEGASRVLEPGMVITVEPGLYLNPDYTDLPAGLDPLGIRIENDVVITDDGHEDLLAGLPTSPDEVAGLVQKG